MRITVQAYSDFFRLLKNYHKKVDGLWMCDFCSDSSLQKDFSDDAKRIFFEFETKLHEHRMNSKNFDDISESEESNE